MNNPEKNASKEAGLAASSKYLNPNKSNVEMNSREFKGIQGKSGMLKENGPVKMQRGQKKNLFSRVYLLPLTTIFSKKWLNSMTEDT